MSKTFADKVIDFNHYLHYSGKLPKGFQVMNPYLNNPETVIFPLLGTFKSIVFI